MSSSTLTYHYILRLFGSISTINHAHFLLYICDVVVVKPFFISFVILKEEFALVSKSIH